MLPPLRSSAVSKENDPILILGAPRSGTTWLAKIFDSHPDVLYRHEPDSVHPCHALPGICARDQLPELFPVAAEYLQKITGIATLRSAGSLPIFRKRYVGFWSHYLRVGVIWAGRFGAAVTHNQDRWEKLPVPDRINRRQRPDPRVLVKSVISLGRARLYAEVRPRMQMILLIRHPCGQVASMMHGISLGKFGAPLYLDGILAAEQAARYSLTAELFHSMSAVEQLAWNWAILNEKALEDLSGRDTVKVVLYDDLCLEPTSVARGLFDFVGLDWPPETDAFLRRSTNQRGAERYYQVFKDTRAALSKWRTELTPAEQESILAIVRQTSIARLYPCLESHLSDPT